MRQFCRCAAVFAALSAPHMAQAAVIINELVYDDGGTDDREFVELYNSGAGAVDISGWTVRNSDTVAPPGDNNADHTIPANTMLAAGDYYVIGMALVPNVDQVVTTTLENDNEGMELFDAGGALQDSVIYERNKGTVAVSPGEGGIWANHTHSEPAGGFLASSVARYLDGRDTNVNGRDFGLRLATPGTSNQGAGLTNAYLAPNVDALATGSNLPGYAYSFVPPRVIEPTFVDTNNLNAIPNPPSGNRAIIGWDPSGGGNGIAQGETMNADSFFDIFAYLDTNDLPVSVNSAAPPVQFRGSEITQYGLVGSVDSFTNLSDVSGQIGVGAGTTSANGATGILWHYEKAGIQVTGGPASETLYLIDAGAGADSNSANAPLDWTVLATIDLSNSPSAWHRLSIDVNADGSGTARFDDQTFNFQTQAGLVGSFYAGYRENTQNGAIGTPSYLRPATWASLPEPGTLLLSVLGFVAMLVRRHR